MGAQRCLPLSFNVTNTETVGNCAELRVMYYDSVCSEQTEYVHCLTGAKNLASNMKWVNTTSIMMMPHANTQYFAKIRIFYRFDVKQHIVFLHPAYQLWVALFTYSTYFTFFQFFQIVSSLSKTKCILTCRNHILQLCVSCPTANTFAIFRENVRQKWPDPDEGLSLSFPNPVQDHRSRLLIAFLAV
jgi:hypothetical protein